MWAPTQDQLTYNLAGFQGRPARSRYPYDTRMGGGILIDRSRGLPRTNRKAERETGLVLNYHLFYFGAEVILTPEYAKNGESPT